MVLSKDERRIPIRRAGARQERENEGEMKNRMPSAPDVPDHTHAEHVDPAPVPGPGQAVGGGPAQSAAGAQQTAGAQPSQAGDTAVDWRDAAMRLRAEMENYRKRQKRWAEDEVAREKADLLRKFLEVVDNLEYALQHIDPRDPAHQGVRLAYDGLLNLLLREGVDRIFAKGSVFDPNRHEAVAMVPASGARDGDDMRVVEVTLPGYMFGERVLRPAKVVVAKPAA